MPLSQKELGDIGEKIAQKYLKNKGYEIIELNYRKKQGEIDLIGKLPDNSLVFFEIKTRKLLSGKYGLPEESVNYFKQKKLRKTAEFFLYENGYSPLETNWRFDVLTIILNAKEKKAIVRHINNAF